ncbi:MAG TPA: efflux RND transporter permease subunit [Dehalococcoidales bacterium]|nr:efflux RND transporter permease subunit [Dehalococcoidales bacterium]
MTWLTKIALKKRWLTFLIVALITGASIWSTLTLQMELIPNIELPVTSVITVYPQAKPEKVMNDVTVHVESAISNIDGLDQLISTAAEGTTFTLAMFEYGTDMDKVNGTIYQNLAKLDLPPEVRGLPATMPQLKENPQLYAIDINMMPVVMVSLTGDMLPSQLEEIAITNIIPRLETIEGVYHVGVDGGSNKQALVNLDAEKMNAAGVSISQVAAIIAGKEYGSLNQLENATFETDTLKLSDIAEVNLGMPPGTSVSRANGQTSVTVSVMKEAEANTVTVANAVIDELESIETTLGNNVRLITVMDQSEYIETSIGDLARNALIGFVLAVIVVFFFLMAFRASLVTAISIPLSLLVSFLAMRFLGITINLLTLSAVAIVVGRVIDNSIVVLEVIYRRMQQGEAFGEAALNGVREVAAPITSSTLATVVIFIPIAFVGGIVGEMFMPFAITMTIALIASLIVALMVIPPLSNFTVSRKGVAKEKHTWYQRAYIPTLKWSLKHRAATLIIAVLLFFGSFSLVPIIGTAFIPQMSEKMLTVDIELPRGTDLATTEEAAIKLEHVIGENPDVKVYQTSAGTSSSLMGSFSSLMGGGGSTASITVILDQEVDLEQQAADIRSNLEGMVEGSSVTVTTGNPMAGGMMGSSLDVSIRGDNYEDIASTGRLLFDELQDVSGLAELGLALSEMEAKLDIVPDPAKMMASGLSMEKLQQISQEFMLMTMGNTVSRVNIDGETYEVFVNGIARDLNSEETAKELMVGWPESVALGDIATVTLGEQQINIQRVNEKLAVSITGIITAEDIGSVNRAVQQKIDALPLPTGVEVTMGGVMEMMQESFSGMFIAIIVAILLAYAVIAVTFRSFLKPIIIMVSLPLASIGALVGLLLAGQPLGVSALMGVLMLVGIVLTNAIVLIDLVEKLRKKGMDTYDALVESGRTRMRPILMTALTTMIAMLPIAVGLGEGTVLSAELAIVVIGGLFSSTLLTLLVIPAIYSLFSGTRRKVLTGLT